MHNIVIKKAETYEIKGILDILEERSNWFENNNINQWPKQHYLKKYNYDYFLNEIYGDNDLYVAKKDETIIGVFLLKYTDKEYWEDTNDSIYIHHLATKLNYPKLGSYILNLIEDIAKNKRKKHIRLDCTQNNEKLNNYYLSNGFILKGTGTTGKYYYNLYEKYIDYDSMIR